MKEFKVTISASGADFTVRGSESVLSAALRQGVMLPYSCKNGTCGSCKGLVESGEVHYPFHPPLALERPEIADGYALMCQAEPLEDLVIKVREIEAVRDIPVRMLPARVTEKTLLADNVMRLKLRLPKAQRLQFLAGQYVDILLPGGKRVLDLVEKPATEDHFTRFARLALEFEIDQDALAQQPLPYPLGQHQAARQPREQRRTEPILELLDLLADRRLGDAQLGRRPGEAGVPGRGLEGAQPVERG